MKRETFEREGVLLSSAPNNKPNPSLHHSHSDDMAPSHGGGSNARRRRRVPAEETVVRLGGAGRSQAKRNRSWKTVSSKRLWA
jgi:hypothetical protein